jgi:hypothetical protein
MKINLPWKPQNLFFGTTKVIYVGMMNSKLEEARFLPYPMRIANIGL